MNPRMTTTICIVTMLISLAALCISLLRCEPMTADWMGVLIGVLSFLATILLGWQIYALFDIREIQKEVKRNKAEANLNMERRMAEAHCALWLFYQGKIEGQQDDMSILLSACLQSGVSATFHFSRCGEYQMAASCLNSLMNLEDILNRTNIEKKMVQSQIRVLLTVENPNMIQGYGEFLSILYRCLK